MISTAPPTSRSAGLFQLTQFETEIFLPGTHRVHLHSQRRTSKARSRRGSLVMVVAMALLVIGCCLALVLTGCGSTTPRSNCRLRPKPRRWREPPSSRRMNAESEASRPDHSRS